MRTIAFICTLAFCINVCAQQVKEDTLQVNQHKYKKCYYPSWVFINRISKDTIVFNKDSWKEYYNAHSITADPRDVFNKYTSPYAGGKEKVFIKLDLICNLQGNLIYAEYSYPRKYDVIPIEVIDKIDTELREKVKITVERRREDIEKNIYNIELDFYFSINLKDADKQ